QEQGALEPIGLRKAVTPLACFKEGQALGQQAQPLGDVADGPLYLGEYEQIGRLRQCPPSERHGWHALAQMRQARLAPALPRQNRPAPTIPRTPCAVASVMRASACAWTAGISRQW